MQRFISLFLPFLLFSLGMLALLSLFRLGLAFWHFERAVGNESLMTLLFNGLRIDLSTLGYLLLIPAMIHPFAISSRRVSPLWQKSIKILFLTFALLVIFFELSTPTFILEYGVRPNRLFIEYLTYPQEVFNMLLHGHLFTLVTVVGLLVLLAIGLWFSLAHLQLEHQRHSIPSRCATSLLLTAVLLLCARGTLGHRPINPAFVYFSADPLVNSLALNSIYSVAHAYKQLGNEKDAAKMYGRMDRDKVIDIVRKSSGVDSQAFKSSQYPSLSERQPVYRGKPKNLVIVLEESLGAQYVSALGGLNLTPHLNALYQQGWGFSHLYATGTRSVRGIEAVVTGFTPTPARSVVKLDKSQQGFFTIASLLQHNGYTTQFVYGGESHFDNMKSFFLGNGFAQIVDFDDIAEPQFVGSWGASDEDLFAQANTELNQLHDTGKPFFSLIFSSSNHDPFEFPPGIVQPIDYTPAQLDTYDSKERLRHQAIQYADYALGKFIATAKSQAYWQDTIFLVVADHDARVLGRDLVPVNNFHIPGVILNSGKAAVLDDRIISQIDLAPTLLSLMGINNVSPMLGHDLNDINVEQRAMMQYADNFAYMSGNQVTILQPSKEPRHFIFDTQNRTLSPGQANPQLDEAALAHALWGSLAYENGWYQADY
ncbi:LTA synthase family protein [Thalassotalea mangrovi]|uniref:LTA synthase family protein n=1 Tax=Thalassotalea mangrovi TaxID=2572245 RepID=A0A4U1B6I0_9GAMM|nr:LTA synthase family protein [Thalassotalea mangrovi]TKB45452.1 LTA synthase family protein [Thalassotalea mangrovi]